MFAASKTDSVDTGGYQISRSLRFNSADGAYLNRTPASAGNRRTFTVSLWMKQSVVSAVNDFFGTTTAFLRIRSNADGKQLQFNDSSVGFLNSNNVLRDPSAWYHFVMAVDTTQATASNRVILYINGVNSTNTSGSYPSQNYDYSINNASEQLVGKGSSYADGYITEVNFIDGQALTPSSFGETDTQTGVWKPKAYSGSYGTNGFYLNFSDNSNTTSATLGKDYSGNGNNWTPNNFSVTAGAGNDSLVDSPTSYGVDTGVGGTVRGNYATLNPLNAGNSAFLNNGNLAITNPSDSNWRTGVSTIGVSSGKWYAEVTVTNNNLIIGLDKASVVFAGTTTFMGGSPTGWGILATGQTYNNSSVQFNNPGYIAGDVIGLGFDADTGVLTFYKNGVAASGTVTGLISGPYVLGFSANNSGNGNINFGQRPFAYTAPSGYKALCTQNLPTPTIGATTATQAGKYFNTVLWTGNNTNPRSITGVGFQPDFSWLVRRDVGYGTFMYDAVRGATKCLSSQSVDAERVYQQVNSFDSDGFTQAGAVDQGNNISGGQYIAWNWKANGSGSTNTSGSITSTVSADTTAGFSIVSYTNASSGTVGHGLGVVPAMVIYKDRNTNGVNWVVLHQSLTNMSNYYLTLNTTNALASGITLGGNPTSSVIYTSTSLANAVPTIAYCFAEVAGYSKFGSYTGNGSSSGPFVYCGFRPAFIMLKSVATGQWCVFDSKRNPRNGATQVLQVNNANAEGAFTSSEAPDLLSNGFRLNFSYGDYNTSGQAYIFMAFAESPFKYSLAR